MPELPEVETIVRELRPRLIGRRIFKISLSKQSLRRQWSAAWGKLLIGRRIKEIRRRGKWILLCLDRDHYLAIHLGMTGQLRVLPEDTPLADHTHLIIGLERGKQQLRFRDVRRFGCAILFEDRQALDQFFEQAAMGPEPFDLKARYWRDRLAVTRRCLKAVLLDQRVVAGVGNIYADEAIFEARLHPTRLGQDLSSAEAARLRRAIVTVLTRAIEKRGSTIRDYIGGTGSKGNYQREFRVYGRTGKPCSRCRCLIERVRLAGRSTHYCPSCQTTNGA